MAHNVAIILGEMPMLRKVALFSEVSDAELDFLTARLRSRNYARGAIIVNEGDEGHALFVIESGSVKTDLSDD